MKQAECQSELIPEQSKGKFRLPSTFKSRAGRPYTPKIPPSSRIDGRPKPPQSERQNRQDLRGREHPSPLCPQCSPAKHGAESTIGAWQPGVLTDRQMLQQRFAWFIRDWRPVARDGCRILTFCTGPNSRPLFTNSLRENSQPTCRNARS
jgi:hypothetical protein